MNEKLRLFIDKLFPPEKKLLKDLTKATKRDKLVWRKSMMTDLDTFTGEYKYYDFMVGFKDRLGVLQWTKDFKAHNANNTISFNLFGNELYVAIMDQQVRLQRQKELPNYNRNASIRDILSKGG
jgi:hypothetical protein